MLNIGQYIPLNAIHASRTNPRKRFNEAELTELASSIKEHGVMQPILVRPLNADEVRNGLSMYAEYEIVAGERRYRASKLAEQENIPCIVRELDDVTAMQLQILENLQRSDLHPLEEAAGFKALLDQANNWNADQLAEKIGKSRTYIYNSLKLLDLCTYVQDKFYEGAIKREVALLISRIPAAKMQEEAAKEIISLDYSYRRTLIYLKNEFTLDLTQAKWDKHATKLPGTETDCTSCLSCPKRTGNYPELYPDIESPDVCTDIACYNTKKQAYAQHVIATVPNVIHGEQAEKVAPHGANSYITNGFVSDYSNAGISFNGKYYSADDVISKDEVEAVPLVDDSGNIKEIYNKEHVETVLRQKLEEKLASGELTLEPTQPSEWEIKRQAREAAQAVEKERRQNAFNRVFPAITSDLTETVLTHAILQMAGNVDLSPIIEYLNFTGSQDDLIKQFLNGTLPNSPHRVQMLGAMLMCNSIEPGYSWESEEDSANDDEYQDMLTFIGNLGLDASQIFTAELPLISEPISTPPDTACANELTAEEGAQAPENKLEEIKQKEVAKRAKKAKGKKDKESAKADA